MSAHLASFEIPERTYRVIVRGTFRDLDDQRHAALLATVDEHDLLTASFTEEGTLCYDRALRNFTFRCVVRQEEDDAELAGLTAVDRTETHLAGLGVGYGELRPAVTSVDDMKIRRPRR